MAKKIFIILFIFLVIYSFTATLYCISTRNKYRSELADSVRTITELTAELGRARTLIDATSLGLERAIGRAEKIKDRDSRIRELISAIKTAISELIGYIAEVQGEAPDN